jgi:hypothetical protein
MKASLEISVSPQSIDLFDAIKNSAINSDLDYSESATQFCCDAIDIPPQLIAKNIKFVTTV